MNRGQGPWQAAQKSLVDVDKTKVTWKEGGTKNTNENPLSQPEKEGYVALNTRSQGSLSVCKRKRVVLIAESKIKTSSYVISRRENISSLDVIEAEEQETRIQYTSISDPHTRVCIMIQCHHKVVDSYDSTTRYNASHTYIQGTTETPSIGRT